MPPRKKPIVAVHKSARPDAPPSPSSILVAIPPKRVHSQSYHFPLLQTDQSACAKLLSWFESVEESRNMPWRKAWMDPNAFDGSRAELGKVLAKRGYEVWVSEVMLQQTRVATVIPFFNNWISKWPTVQDLAGATHDEVLAAWKGLGYYSRATRLHEGAKAMIAKSSDSSSPIPSGATDLQQFPGIGKYTGGAISSIAFGEAEPVLDGNVARVLSRQLGLYVNVKDKKPTDSLWEVADQLIKHVSNYPDVSKSSIPGQWNQALMELGSTLCTPQPRCEECPIQSTCRVFKEGQALAKKEKDQALVPDIEDACTQCEVLDNEDLILEAEEMSIEENPRAAKKIKTAIKQSNTISNYFTSSAPKPKVQSVNEDGNMSDASKKRKAAPPNTVSKSVLAYCSMFPKKVAKKEVAEEHCVVCMIELCLSGGKSKWLIEKRPAKGLLASLWQFPPKTLPEIDSTSSGRKTIAQEYISGLELNDIDTSKADRVATFPALVHVFTHLKLTMHPFHYKITIDETEVSDPEATGAPLRKWVDAKDMDDETLSTGMRRCWDLVVKGG